MVVTSQTDGGFMVQAIPQGFNSVTPFFMSKDADGLVAFMKKGLGAEEIFVLKQQNGKVAHAQMKIGDSMVMVGDSMEKPALPLCMYIYSHDADAAYRRALEAGATSIMEPADQFYGDRNGGVEDASGNIWWFATHIEDVSEDELRKRAKMFEKKAA
jgi:PhnB protein